MNSLLIVIEFIFPLLTIMFLVRFLLQASRADFYNPISQAVVKGTDIVCKPLRMIVPTYRNLDFASILVAWLVCIVAVVAIHLIRNGAWPPIAPALWVGLVRMLLVVLQFFMFSIFITIIASWLAPGSHHPALALLHQLIEPVMGPVRRILPNLGPLDLSPMAVLLIIFVLEDILRRSV